jgi:hypothetical protein
MQTSKQAKSPKQKISKKFFYIPKNPKKAKKFQKKFQKKSNSNLPLIQPIVHVHCESAFL